MLAAMPMGDAGTQYTLRMMASIARGASKSPVVATVARQLVAQLPATPTAQVGAIRRYLSTHVVFQNDPPGIEYVQQPVRLVQEITQNGETYGDCDDVATLGAALGLALGYQARYVVTAFKPQPTPYAHVYLQLRGSDGVWQTLDTTRPRGFQPQPTRMAMYPI
jgi:transglutaminase-like putative cysteine protease